MKIWAVRGVLLAVLISMYGVAATAAQYAALVMDARTGKVLHARNADTRLHPASLTKMMTLYVVFDEIKRGRLSLDQKVTISRYVARKPPSKIGYRAGDRVQIRYLIRAAAVKSANDAAAALAEAVSGSEAEFAKKMTAMAKAMGLRNTTFKNASGLTQSGHLSTASDMAQLGRRLFYDFPQYYNLFGRRSTSVGSKTVYNTNRRLLAAYQGADGIKTGFTRAAGYNLVSSAKRGQERVIVSMFGGTSSAQRNARVAELMDMGFQRMPSYARVQKPGPISYSGDGQLVARATRQTPRRLSTKLTRTMRPVLRPGTGSVLMANLGNAPQQMTRAVPNEISEEIKQAVAAAVVEAAPQTGPARTERLRPKPRPSDLRVIAAATPARDVTPNAAAPPASGSWSVNLGLFGSRGEAERMLLQAALQDLEAFEGGVRKVDARADKGRTVYRARFVGLSKAAAENACARLASRQTACSAVAPGGS